MRDRATRRKEHFKARASFRSKVKNTWGNAYISTGFNLEKYVACNAENPAACSCDQCGNPRRAKYGNHGLSLQELRAPSIDEFDN